MTLGVGDTSDLLEVHQRDSPFETEGHETANAALPASGGIRSVDSHWMAVRGSWEPDSTDEIP